MNQQEFWKLYDGGNLKNVTIWHHLIDAGDARFEEEMICFRYNNKFYIRFTKFHHWELNFMTHKRTGNAYSYSFIKEFDMAQQANNYFCKCRKGFIKEA